MFGTDPNSLGAMAPSGLQFAPQKPKGGMFGGGKFGFGQAIVAALNGYLAGTGNPVGMQNMQMMQQMAEGKRRDARDDRQHDQQLQDQMSLIDYRAAHQAPDDFTQMMQAAGVDPNSERGKALYLQAVQNKANPFTQMRVQNPDGSETLQFMRPPQVPTAPVGKLTPLGGPTPQASGGFPY